MDINKYGAKGRTARRQLFSLSELEEGEIYEILWLAKKLKQKQQVKEKLGVFDGKNVAIMLKSSASRTRISFELAVNRIGGKTLYLSPADADFYNGLTYLDAAHILRSYGANGLIAKNLSAEEIAELKASALPVINLKDGRANACQALADLFTIWETAGRLSGVKYAVFGDLRNPGAEVINFYVKCGLEVTLCAPPELLPQGETLRALSQFGDVALTSDAAVAMKNAEAVTSIARADCAFGGFSVTPDVMELSPQAKFLHILPVRHGEEVSDDVLYGPRSAVFVRSANLIYAEQAAMMLFFR